VFNIVFEPDKPAIKEMIDTRRQEQAILAIEPFLVRRVAPWLAVTRDEVDRVVGARNTAA
jgi:hypothetical protein